MVTYGGIFMNRQDNRLAFSVVATLLSGIALIYTLIVFPHIIFAVAGTSLVFIIAAFILTQNIMTYAYYKEKSLNDQIKENTEFITTRLETMNAAQSQLDKATFLYTKQVARTLSTLENNYTESQEALYKNLSEISNTQNKSTKLMLKYNQSTTTKMISTLKDLRNQLSETMIQGFDQIQPNNAEIIETLEDIVDYLKTQSNTMEQSMGLQLNNVAHELQNISNSIQTVQVTIPQVTMPQVSIPPVAPVTVSTAEMSDTASIPETPVAPEISLEPALEEEPLPEETLDVTTEESLQEDMLSTELPTTEMLSEEIIPEEPLTEEAVTTETPTTETLPEEAVMTETSNTETISEESASVPSTMDDPNKQLSADEIAALFAAAEPTPKKEVEDVAEDEEPFVPTFTVVGKEEPAKTIIKEEPMETVSDDPNKQLSPDEIAALFAAAEPAPQKVEKTPEPVEEAPVLDDPNKQLSPDEIAALFAAAEPAPKKEEVPEAPSTTTVSDDPNKQLSPEEIAALFASMGG